MALLDKRLEKSNEKRIITESFLNVCIETCNDMEIETQIKDINEPNKIDYKISNKQKKATENRQRKKRKNGHRFKT